MKISNSLRAFRNRVMLAAVTLASALVLTVGFNPGTASAAWGDCLDNAACLWIDINAGGPMYYYKAAAFNYCHNLHPSWDNAVSSVFNRKWDAAWVRLYTLPGCGAFYYTTNYNQAINFTSWPHADSFSSLWIQL